MDNLNNQGFSLEQYRQITNIEDIIRITENFDCNFIYDCNWTTSGADQILSSNLILNHPIDSIKKSILIDNDNDWYKFQNWFILEFPPYFYTYYISMDDIKGNLFNTEFKRKFIADKLEEVRKIIAEIKNDDTDCFKKRIFIDCILESRHLRYPVIPFPCEGINDLLDYYEILELHKVEQYLDSLINLSDPELINLNNDTLFIYENAENFNEKDRILIDKVSHKILLLHKMGVLNFIVEKYYHNQKGTELAKLLGSLFNSDKSEIETIRKTLSFLDHKKHKNNPENKTSLKAVKQLLLEFGIDLTELHLID